MSCSLIITFTISNCLSKFTKMDYELTAINNDLKAVLTKLSSGGRNEKPVNVLQHRKHKIAMLIKLHVQHIQHTVVVNRRRRQQRARRRLQLLRSFFLKQLLYLQSSYVQMFAMLKQKHARLKLAAQINRQTQPAPTVLSNDKSVPVHITTQFFEQVLPELSDELFLSNLHVTRRTFKWLCAQLAPILGVAEELKKRTEQDMDISPEKCVALSLYFLASGKRLTVIAQQFALVRMRAIKCLKIFCNSVMSSLGKAMQLLPQSEADCANVISGFQKVSNMPPALVGVLGVCSIPKRGKQAGSLLRMEYLLDHKMLFRELQLSDSNKDPVKPMYGQTPSILTQLPKRCINKRMVPAFVLAPVHQNFPLRPWLLQRYLDPVAPHEYDFNEVAEYLHELSDCALHRLLLRWRFLSQPLDISFNTASCIITAACVLHNVLEELAEPHMLEWGSNVNVTRLKPARCIPKPDACEEAEHALEIRDFLARTISSTEM